MKLTHIKYSLLLPLLLLLSSCQDYNGMKQRLVNGYQGLDAYCLFVGRIDFPYLAQPITNRKTQEDNDFYTNRLNNERLPAFEKAGLLTAVPTKRDNGQYYPLYSLTDEGKKYFKLTHNTENTKIYAQFCFGRREILEVTDMYDRETDFYGGKTTETTVKFTYNLHDVPEWVNHPAIKGIKQYNINFSGDNLNKKGRVYLTKKDGTYYNYSTSLTIETIRLGYYL